MSLPHLEATNGEEALKVLLKNKISLVLLDINMPKMNGVETVRLMKGNNSTKNIPVIFMSASGKDEPLVREEFTDMRIDYMIKPFTIEVLKDKVAYMLRDGKA
jgi:DNA-binding response OmpR family regulator